MVTVHHLQGKLNARRAIIADSVITSSIAPQLHKNRSFVCAGQNFSVYESPTQALTDFTLEQISAGNTAAVIPSNFLTPKALFFDMDATVIAEESLVEIAAFAGKKAQIEAITVRAMAGGMDFKESLQLRLRELAGIRRDDIMTIVPTINKGMREVSEWATDLGAPLFLISGGFVEMAEPVARLLGFKDYKANRFAWSEEGLMLGYTDGPVVDAQGKKEALLSWCKHHTIEYHQSIAIGDGANDLPMMNTSGFCVGFMPKRILWPHLHCNNQTGDHRFLIHCFT
jgi:phosphoserine phosphatase